MFIRPQEVIASHRVSELFLVWNMGLDYISAHIPLAFYNSETVPRTKARTSWGQGIIGLLFAQAFYEWFSLFSFSRSSNYIKYQGSLKIKSPCLPSLIIWDLLFLPTSFIYSCVLKNLRGVGTEWNSSFFPEASAFPFLGPQQVRGTERRPNKLSMQLYQK